MLKHRMRMLLDSNGIDLGRVSKVLYETFMKTLYVDISNIIGKKVDSPYSTIYNVSLKYTSFYKKNRNIILSTRENMGFFYTVFYSSIYTTEMHDSILGSTGEFSLEVRNNIFRFKNIFGAIKNIVRNKDIEDKEFLNNIYNVGIFSVYGYSVVLYKFDKDNKRMQTANGNFYIPFVEDLIDKYKDKFVFYDEIKKVSDIIRAYNVLPTRDKIEKDDLEVFRDKIIKTANLAIESIDKSNLSDNGGTKNALKACIEYMSMDKIVYSNRVYPSENSCSDIMSIILMYDVLDIDRARYPSYNIDSKNKTNDLLLLFVLDSNIRSIINVDIVKVITSIANNSDSIIGEEVNKALLTYNNVLKDFGSKGTRGIDRGLVSNIDTIRDYYLNYIYAVLVSSNR